jgi:3-oxoacyl-[acyl-carrier protein] reductase
MADEALDDDALVRRSLATTPLLALARPADIANAIVFLSSPLLARHVTGETLTVAGGMEGRLRWTPEQIDPAALRGAARAK